MLNIKSLTKPKMINRLKSKTNHRLKMVLGAIGVTGLVTGCTGTAISLNGGVEAQDLSSSTPTLTPTAVPPTATPTPTLTNTPSPTATPWPTPTAWPTPTPWPTPSAWSPARQSLPTLEPVPVVPAALLISGAGIPVSYSPPDGVDVFGSTILRWEFFGLLAPDEYFDIRIKPAGSNDSAFVDWTKATTYELHPWSGWTPGLYTWQIGIVKGHLEGDTKQFIADTGRDSQAFLIKWQAAGGGGSGGGGGGGNSGGGGGSSGGS
jgi:uncharacterized membrane protein YgcG